MLLIKPTHAFAIFREELCREYAHRRCIDAGIRKFIVVALQVLNKRDKRRVGFTGSGRSLQNDIFPFHHQPQDFALKGACLLFGGHGYSPKKLLNTSSFKVVGSVCSVSPKVMPYIRAAWRMLTITFSRNGCGASTSQSAPQPRIQFSISSVSPIHAVHSHPSDVVVMVCEGC